MFGRELARQVSLSLHHCAETLDAGPPDTAVLTGLPLDPAAVTAFEVLSGLTTAPAATVAAPNFAAAVADDAPGGPLASWLRCVGLSCYPPAALRATEAA